MSNDPFGIPKLQDIVKTPEVQMATARTTGNRKQYDANARLANNPLRAMGKSDADANAWDNYQDSYDKAAQLNDKDVRLKMYNLLQAADDNAVDNSYAKVIGDAEKLARKQGLGFVTPEILDESLQGNNLASVKDDGDLYNYFHERSNQRYGAANGLYQLRKRNGLLKTPEQKKAEAQKATANSGTWLGVAQRSNQPQQQPQKSSTATTASAPQPQPATTQTQEQPGGTTPVNIDQAKLTSVNGLIDLHDFLVTKPIQKDALDPVKILSSQKPKAVEFAYTSPIDVANTPKGEPVAQRTKKVYVDGATASNPQAFANVEKQIVEQAQLQDAYAPQTRIPIGYDQKKNAFAIGNLDQAEKDLSLEFVNKVAGLLIDRAALTGDKTMTMTLAQSIAKDLYDTSSDYEEDAGLLDWGPIDAVKQTLRDATVTPAKLLLPGYWGEIGKKAQQWRSPFISSMLNYFTDGITNVGEDKLSALTDDESVKDIVRQYRDRLYQIKQLRGAEGTFGNEIPMELFHKSENPLDASNRQDFWGSIARAGVAIAGKDLIQPVERVWAGTRVDDLENRFNKQIKPSIANYRKGSVPSSTELRGIISANITDEEQAKALQAQEFDKPSVANTTMNIVGGLIGSLKGPGGSLKISSSALGRASSLARESKILNAALAKSEHVQKLAGVIGKSKAFQEPVHTAATFLLSHLIERMPNATEEELADAAVKGAIFGSINTAFGEAAYSLAGRSNAYQKLLQKPLFRKALDEAAGSGAANSLERRLAAQKDVMYSIGGIVANPVQGATMAALDNQEYDTGHFLADMLIGPAMALQMRRDMRKYGSDLKLDSDYFTAKAFAIELASDELASERYAEQINGTPKNKTKAEEQQAQNQETAQKTYEPEEPINEEEVDAELFERLNNRPSQQDVPRATAEPKASEAGPAIETTFGQRINEIGDFESRLDEQQKFIYDLVKDQAGQSRVVYHDGDTYFDKGDRTIYVSKNQQGTADEINSLLHESAHAASFERIDNDPQFRRDLEKLRDKVLNSAFFKKWADEGNHSQAAYMAQDLHEFFVGFVDNRFGIGTVIAKNARSTGGKLRDMAAGFMGNSDISADKALQQFRDVATRLRTQEKVEQPTPQEHMQSATTAEDMQSAIDHASMVDAFAERVIAGEDLTDAESLQFYQNNAKAVEDAIAQKFVDYSMQSADGQATEVVTADTPMGEKLSLYKDVSSLLKIKGIRDDNQRAEAIIHGREFIREMNKIGIKDEIALGHFVSSVASTMPHWESMTELEQARALRSWATKVAEQKDPEIIATLEQMSADVDAAKDLLNTDNKIKETIKSPAFDKRAAAQMVGAENVKELERNLRELLAKPANLVEYVTQQSFERASAAGVDAAKLEDVRQKAQEFALNYLINQHNTLPITPLGVGSMIGSDNLIITNLSGRKVDPASSKPLQTEIQNPTALFRGMDRVATQVLYPHGNAEGARYSHLTDRHAELVNNLTRPGIGIVSNSDLLEKSASKLFTGAESIGKEFLRSGWYFVPKGLQGNLFFNLKPLHDRINNRPEGSTLAPEYQREENIRNVVKDIEELHLTHFLTSENLWGVGAADVAQRTLANFDLWKLVKMAQEGRIFEPTEKIGYAIQPTKLADEKWVEQATKNADQMRTDANEIIKRLIEHYKKNDLGDGPEVLHTSKDAPEAILANALNIYYSKIVDHGNSNDVLFHPITGKRGKQPIKYIGVQTGFDYTKFADVGVMQTILDGSSRFSKPMNIRGLQGQERTEAIEYWRDKGIILTDNGPKMKQFMLTDAWAEANPDLWLELSGQYADEKIDPPSEWHDGASWLINRDTHAALATLYNKNPNDVGNIKQAYGGDHIYKSSYAPLFDTGGPLVSEFVGNLKRQGIAAIATQSTIKSQAHRYIRKQEEPGVTLIHDHNGSLKAIQKDGNVNPVGKDDLLARYTNRAIAPELVQEYDLAGENAMANVRTVTGNPDFKDVKSGIDNTPYTAFDNAPAIDRAMTTLLQNKARAFGDTYRGYQELFAANTGGTTKNPESARFVKRILKKLKKSQDPTEYWGDNSVYESVVRHLENTLLDDGMVDAAAIQSIDQIFPGLFTNTGVKKESLATQVLKDDYEAAVAGSSLGKQYELTPYVPKQQHQANGWEHNSKWKQIELQERIAKQAKSGFLDIDAEVAERAEAILERHRAEFDIVVAEHYRGSAMAPESNGVVVSYKDLDAVNKHIQQLRREGHDIPYMYVGSKVITKLNPSDAITSWSPSVIIGVDTDMNTGMMMNPRFAIKELGRDHDGDGMTIIYPHDDWERDPRMVNRQSTALYDSVYLDGDGSSNFENYWQALYNAGAHRRDKYKIEAADIIKDSQKEFKVLDPSKPVKIRTARIDARTTTNDGMRKTMDAQAMLGENMGMGISQLNSFYAAMRLLKAKSGDVMRLSPGFKQNPFISYEVTVDPELLKTNDAYYKQSQYDRYGYMPFDPNELFFKSRVSNVKLATYSPKIGSPEVYEAAKVAVDRYRLTGEVDPLLIEGFNGAISARIPRFTKKEALVAQAKIGAIVAETNAQLKNVHAALRATANNKQIHDRQLHAGASIIGTKRAFVERIVQTAGQPRFKDYELLDRALQPFKNESSVFANQDPFREFDAIPRNWTAETLQDPAFKTYFNEYLSRLYAPEDGSVDIIPGYAWEYGPQGVYLKTPEGAVAAGKLVTTDGLHPAITHLQENNVPIENIFPSEIMGKVQVQDVLNSDKNRNLPEYLKANPDVALVRISNINIADRENAVKQGFVTVKQNRNNTFDFVSTAEYPNFIMLAAKNRTQDQLRNDVVRAVKSAVAQGKRVIIDRTTLGTEESILALPSNILDIGRTVKINRAVNDAQRQRLAGKYIGMQDKDLGYAFVIDNANTDLFSMNQGLVDVGEITTTFDLISMYKGLKDVGANTTTPAGIDALDHLLYDLTNVTAIDRYQPYSDEVGKPVDEREGYKLGLFNGKLNKIKGTELGQGRSSALNRLNRHLGKKIWELSLPELQEIESTVSDFVRQEFGNVPDVEALIDGLSNVINPQALAKEEQGTWAKLRKDYGEAEVKAAKFYHFGRMLSELEDIAKNQNRGGFKNAWDKWGWWAKQSTVDMIKHFANDVKPYSGQTQIYSTTDVSYSPNGVTIVNKPVLLNQTRSMTDGITGAKVVSAESGTVLRHMHWNKHLNGLKDAMASMVDRWREDTGKIFTSNGTFTRAGMEAANNLLTGNNSPFYRRETIPVEMVPDPNGGTDLVPVGGGERIVPFQPTFVDSWSGDYIDQSMPIASVTFTNASTGESFLYTTTKDAQGMFTQNELDRMVKHLMPDDSYELQEGVSRAEIESALRWSLTAKAHNTKLALYQTAYAQGIRDYAQSVVKNNLVQEVDEQTAVRNESVRQGLQNIEFEARTLAKEMDEESASRINSSIADNLSAMTFVNYDEFASTVGDYTSKYKDMQRQLRAMERIKGGKDTPEYQELKMERDLQNERLANLAQRIKLNVRYNQNATELSNDELASLMMSHLNKRLAWANGQNSQLSKTVAHFQKESSPDDYQPVVQMYNLDDSRVLEELLADKGYTREYQPDVIFQKNKDAIDNISNRSVSVFQNAYTTEKKMRAAIGKEHLESGIAEDNLLADISNESTIYQNNVDVHSPQGLRAQLKTIHSDHERVFLTPEEIGIPLATPIALTFKTDTEDGRRTILGRLIGVGRLPNEVKLTESVKAEMDVLQTQINDALQSGVSSDDPRLQEMQNRLNEAMSYVNTNDADGFKDMIAIYNQEAGSLNYIDLATVTNATTGGSNGFIGKLNQSARSKFVSQAMGDASKLGQFLFSDLVVQTIKSKNSGGIKTIESMVDRSKSSDGLKTKNIGLFAAIGREDVPHGIAKIFDTMGNMMNASSSWYHGYGNKAALLALSVPVALAGSPMVGAGMATAAVGSGLIRYAKNWLGNTRSPSARLAQLSNAYSASNIFGQFRNQDPYSLGSPVAMSAARRISRGVGLDPQINTSSSIAKDRYEGWTLPLVRQYNELTKIKKYYDGLGKILTDQDLAGIQAHIEKSVTLKDKVVADIRNGQLSLSLRDAETDQYIRSLDDLHKSNLDVLNQMLVGVGKMGRMSMHVGPEGSINAVNPFLALARLNNARLQVYGAQGSFEEAGVLQASQETEQKVFNVVNANKPIYTDPVARVNFVNAMVDVVQGKFDQRAYHLRTPLGKALTLFSQYNQNFNRRTSIGVRQEQLFWKGMFDAIADDPEFRQTLVTKYGVNVGTEIIETPFVNFGKNNDPNVVLGGYVAPTKAYGASLAMPLLAGGLGYLIAQGLQSGLGQNPIIESQGDSFSQQIMGSGSIAGQILNGAVQMIMESIVYGVDGQTAKQYQGGMTSAVKESVRGLPGGMAYTGAKEALGILGLYMMHTSGILPEYKSPDWLGFAKQSAGGVGIMMSAPTELYQQTKKIDNAVNKKNKSSSSLRLSNLK